MSQPDIGKFVVQQIELTQVRKMPTARPLDDDHVETLVGSIKRSGLLQPIGVTPDGDHFLLVAGNHRFAAISRLGLKVIDAVILPGGMAENDLLLRSLHENHIRKDESVEDMLVRIQALAAFEKCSLSNAAKQAGVSSATLSKIQKIVKSLSAPALELIHKHKIGNAIAYEVARLATSEEQQLEWLDAHSGGQMSREDIRKAATVAKTPSAKVVRLDLAVGDIGVKLSIPAALGYDALLESIASLRSQILKQQKREIAFELLPKVLKTSSHV